MAKRMRLLEENRKVLWEEALEEFVFWKQANGLSDRTLEDYLLHVNMFFKRFPTSWQSKELRQSVLQYMSDKIKPATYNLRLIYLRAFFQWCLERRYLMDNPANDLKKRKVQNRIVRLEVDILKELLELPDQNTYVGLRDLALILLSLDTGIRPSEAFSLLEKDFDFKHFIVTIPNEAAKTRKERCLPILPITVETIKKVIKARHSQWNDEIPVFTTYEGNKISRYTWNDRLNKYSKQLGIKIRPYDLRHTFSVLYLRNGGNAFGLQKSLGHADMQMTRRYVDLTGEDLREIHLKASPLNLLLKKSSSNRVRKINKT